MSLVSESGGRLCPWTRRRSAGDLYSRSHPVGEGLLRVPIQSTLDVRGEVRLCQYGEGGGNQTMSVGE